jgi:hypothetical protein
MNLEEIKQAIKEWSNARTSPEAVLTYFKQGCCFKIEKIEYEQWKKNSPKNLHVYMGIFKDVLKIVLIDSVSDKDPAAHEDSIFVRDYLPGLDIKEEGFIEKATDGNITVKDGLMKIMQWTVFKDSWVYNVVPTINGVFQAFTLPFSDLIAQFEGTMHTESVVLFGLCSDNQADLILWVLGTNEAKMDDPDDDSPLENIAYPCPPFGGDDFGLLGN